MEHISCRLDYGGVIKTVGRCLPPGKSTLGGKRIEATAATLSRSKQLWFVDPT
jgi:hypothetical protein